MLEGGVNFPYISLFLLQNHLIPSDKVQRAGEYVDVKDFGGKSVSDADIRTAIDKVTSFKSF